MERNNKSEIIIFYNDKKIISVNALGAEFTQDLYPIVEALWRNTEHAGIDEDEVIVKLFVGKDDDEDAWEEEELTMSDLLN